jgi:hypothetical protein
MTILVLLDSHDTVYLTGEIVPFTLCVDRTRSFILYIRQEGEEGLEL